MSRPWDLNPQPMVYDTIALPIELGWLTGAGERNRPVIRLGVRSDDLTDPNYKLRTKIHLERDTRIGLALSAWEADVLPLY